MQNPDRSYFRKEIDIEFNKVKAALHAESVERGEGVALFQDCYTNKTLRGGDSYDYEHIRSSEEVFMKYRDILTNEEIAKVVNCVENVKVTQRSINQSKGKRRFEEWAKLAMVVSHDLCMKTALENVRRADKGIERALKKIMEQVNI